MDITITLFYQPIFNLTVALYRLFSENLGLAIIGVALISRLITLPITWRQRKMMGKSKELSEKMKAIKEKHKNNKEKEQEEIMKLNSEYMPGQIAGCLPAILQFIIFINIYNVIRELFTHGPTAFNNFAYSFVPAFNEGYQLKYSFLGVLDLSKHPADFASQGLVFLPYIIILALVAITQYYSMKTSMNTMPATQQSKEEKKKKDKKKSDGPEDFGEILQQSTKQTMFLFPIMFVLISYSLPTGLSVYWIVQSTFVIIQQLVLSNLGKIKLGLTKKQSNDIIAEPIG